MVRHSTCKRRRVYSQGMTLLELLVVISILASLSAIMYPTYLKHTLAAHRTVALSDLMRIQLSMESSFADNQDEAWRHIVEDGVCHICDSSPKRYQFAIVRANDASYTIIATALPIQGQDQDSCFPDGVTQLSLTSRNEEKPSACWQ